MPASCKILKTVLAPLALAVMISVAGSAPFPAHAQDKAEGIVDLPLPAAIGNDGAVSSDIAAPAQGDPMAWEGEEAPASEEGGEAVSDTPPVPGEPGEKDMPPPADPLAGGAAPEKESMVEDEASRDMEAPGEVPAGGAEALEARVGALEKALEELRAGFVDKKDFDSLKARVSALEKAPAATDKKKPAAAAPAKKAAPVARKEAAAPKKWVLKSARPGMAWVSEEGSRELKTISVGEELPGIGKIQSIGADSGGRWVVEGTRGKIVQ